MPVSINNCTRRRTAPRSAFNKIAKIVLPDWDISLAFVGAKKAHELNNQLRNKDYIPNVLSYVVGKKSGKSGEIIICLSEADKQAPAYNLSPTSYHLYLFIHGALHIKGWAHGAKMEKYEQDILKTVLA